LGFSARAEFLPVVVHQSRRMGRARFHVVPASRTRGGRSLACPAEPPRPLPVATALAAGPTGPRGIPLSSTPFRAPPSEVVSPDDVPRPTGASPALPHGIARWAAPRGLRTLLLPGGPPPRLPSSVTFRPVSANPRCREAAFRTQRSARTGVAAAEAPLRRQRGSIAPVSLVTRPDRAAGAR